MVFDLGEVAQLTESQITFCLDNGPQNMHGFGAMSSYNNNDPVIPQLVIIEGKKESPFNSKSLDGED